MKHSRQGVAIGAAAALGLAMLGAAPASASGDADFIDLHFVAPGNGVMAGIMEQEFGLLLDWDGDVDTSDFDKLTFSMLSVVDQNGDPIEFAARNSEVYYDYEDDDLYYETYYEDEISAPASLLVPWAASGTDNVATGNGYVGPFSYDGTKLDYLNANDTYYSDYFGRYLTSPWVSVTNEFDYEENGNPWDESEGVTKVTYRIQAFLDSNLNGRADVNEIRSSVATVTQFSEHYLTGTITQGTVPGWYYPEIEPTIVLDQKITDFSWEEDNGMDEEVAEESYYLKLQQVDSDGNDPMEFGSWDLEDYNVHEDGKGWGIAEDGTVTYSDKIWSYTNEGSKVNKVWLHSPERDKRVSNVATFGYGISSKIAKVNNTSAKMYAYNVLNVGVVEFFHNGKRIARFDITDATDPRALAGTDGPYVVRTVNFVRGKNTLELKLNGVSVKKHTYTLRAGMV